MTYRVIQWATGAMGKTCLRALIDHPEMELVGLYVHGEGKVGRDAGDIAHRPQTNIIATNDVDAVLAIEADVVVHCARLAPPYGSDVAEIARILASGKNVISINGHSDPQHWQGERRTILEAACAAGRSSLMGAGLNPGFVGEQLAAIATGICSRLDHIEIIESADGRNMRSPDYVFGVLGFGSDPANLDVGDPNWAPAAAVNGMFEEMLWALANRLRWPLDRIVADHRVFAATEDLHIAAGVIRQGTVSHLNLRWLGFVADTPRLTLSINWHMETAHFEDGPPSLWRVRLEGEPGVRISVDLSKRADDTTRTEPEQLALAGSVINTIPVVCAADPGLHMRPIATPFQAQMASR